MRYTEEQLMELPLNIVQNVDIENGDDEALVQKVLNIRRKDLPMTQVASFPSYMTNDITIEKEQELQAIIDAKKAQLMARFEEGIPSDGIEEPVVGDPIPDVTPEMHPDDTPISEPSAAPVPDVVLEPVIEPEVPVETPVAPEVAPEPVVVPVEPEIVPEARFCNDCDSKGVRHKKECVHYVPTKGFGSPGYTE